MLSYILYLINLLRLKWLLLGKKVQNRFDLYSPYGDIIKQEETGLLANETDWYHSTPNLNRKENVTIIASNTFDRSSLSLSLKWRPTSELNVTTLLSRLSFQVGDVYYDYDDVCTYTPTESRIRPGRITQFGSNGSSLKLYVLYPYSRYRIVFRGYMRNRNSPNESRFVQLNLLAFLTSKIYDFKEQFHPEYLAEQVANQKPACGLTGALNDLVLHERHEHTIRFMGEYSIQDGPDSSRHQQAPRSELHLWGFHSRQYIDDRTQKLRNKRILGHFSNGRAFHIGVVENIDNKFDIDQQFSFGYSCFNIGPATGPVTAIQSLKWNQVSSNSLLLKFGLSGQDFDFSIEAKRREAPSELLDMKLDSTPGWGVILINDALDTGEDLHAVEVSLREYQHSLASGSIVRPELFDLNREFAAKPLVVAIEDPDCLYPSLVGAKAASLAQLKLFSSKEENQNNYTVPRAVMLTRYAYEAIQAENPDLKLEIRSLVARVGRGELNGLQLECERLQNFLEKQSRLPDSCRSELRRLISEQFGLKDADSLDGRSFAVRSSSWGEDEEDMSAAGQLVTVLEVRGFENLVAAVMKCFASKFGHINIEYKRQHGLPLDLPMAVVVQEMIECEKAGVLFTCDPTNGDAGRLTITANYGLGESVVSGQTDPDSISVRVEEEEAASQPKLSIEGTQIGAKKVILSGSGDSNGVREVGAEAQFDRSKCCLSQEEIMRLARCGLQLVRYFQSQRDIEWGFKDGLLHLFQSRPVTGLESFNDYELSHECDQPSRAELEFTTRANINEVMPYPLTPMQVSFGIKIWPIISGRFFGKLKTIDPADYSMYYSAEFLHYHHYAFFSLRGGALFNFSKIEGQERLPASRALEVGIFGREVDDDELVEKATEMAKMKYVRFQELIFDWHTIGSRYRPRQRSTQIRKQLKRLRRDVHSLRLAKSGPNMKGLYEQLLDAFSQGEDSGTHHLACTIISSKMNFELLQLLSKYISDPIQLHLAFSKFLSSSPNVLSAEIPRRVDRMAKLINERGSKDVESFVSMKTGEALKYVSSDLKSKLAKEFDDFMVKFGHRCYNEFEISHRSWRDQPEQLIEMLQANVRRYLSGANKVEDISNKTTPSTEEVIQSLNINLSFWDRLKLKYLIAPRCTMFVSAREQTKDCMIEYHDVLRDASRLLAKEMRQNNRIPDEDLFYYLWYNEIEPLIREPQPSIVVQAVRRRRKFESMKGAWHFDEIMRGHKMIPVHMKQSKELSAKLANAPRLIGTTASSGRVQARVCVVETYEELGNVQPGDILVAYSTDIGFSPIFPLISGVITEVGGLISHGAVIAREYGLPSVIGVENVTKILKSGEEVVLDADEGAIIRLSQQQEGP